jgi:uncharacterized OB-fold protein
MTTATTTKPLPVPTPTSQPYWDGLRAHELRMQRCSACGKIVFYPRSNCSFCLSPELAWERIAGDGTVYTFTIARRATAPQFEDEVPQQIAVVELDEGPRITTTLVNVEPDQIKIGMRVRPIFDDLPNAEVTLLRYAPA